LDTQLAAAETERSSLVKKLDELQEKYDRYDEMIKRTPIVEKDYEALMRDYQSATRKYQDILNNTREAGLSKSLEQSRKGERFILIEPPARPADPISPNRPAIIFLGLVFGVGAGLGTALLREALDGSIHGMRELTSIMGEPAFVAIPYLENEEDMTQQQRLRKAFLVGGLAVSVLLVLYLHFFYIPLDVMYFSVLNKLGFN
jgi:hypothetical protein